MRPISLFNSVIFGSAKNINIRHGNDGFALYGIRDIEIIDAICFPCANNDNSARNGQKKQNGLFLADVVLMEFCSRKHSHVAIVLPQEETLKLLQIKKLLACKKLEWINFRITIQSDEKHHYIYETIQNAILEYKRTRSHPRNFAILSEKSYCNIGSKGRLLRTILQYPLN